MLPALLLLIFSQGMLAEEVNTMDHSQLSCNELYVLASHLEPNTQRYRSTLFNEKTDVIATAIGTVIQVGYYYFGFSTALEYFENFRANQSLKELNIIRQYMAQQYCFQKF